MDYKRAQQIFNANETIRVQHRGKDVWIERLDREGETALVSNDGETTTVPVSELLEG